MVHSAHGRNLGPVSENFTETALTDWYRGWRRRQHGSSITICECTTETLISECDNPALMRAFLFVAVSMDEAMRTNPLKGGEASEHYSEFRKHFGFPRVEPHGDPGDGLLSPDWLIYQPHGRDKLMDWPLCAQVAATLIGSVRHWLKEQGHPDESWACLCPRFEWMVSTVEHYSPDAALRVTAALGGSVCS